MQIGYARVSTQAQYLRRQYEVLEQAQCDKIYEDKASGVKGRTSADIGRRARKRILWSCGNSTGWGVVGESWLTSCVTCNNVVCIYNH